MINFFNKKKKEPMVDGMTFSFRVKPKLKGFGYQDTKEFFEGSGMSQYFSQPIVKLSQENDYTIITIRFLESKFEAKIDDPILVRLRKHFVESTNEFFKLNTFTCEVEETGIMIDIDDEMTSILFFDKNGNHILRQGKQMKAIKEFFTEQQIEASIRNNGIELLKLLKFNEALTIFEKLLESDPDNSEVLSFKGTALMGLERFEEAIKCYDKVLETNPNLENVLNNKGLALSSLGKHNEAIECYDKAIEINPNYEKAFYNKGLEFDSLGKLKESLECYDKAIEINPHYEKALIKKGLTEIRIKLDSEKSSPLPKDNLEIICPHCENKTKLIYIDDYQVDKKNPLDVWALENTDDMVFPEMNKPTYDFIVKNRYENDDTLFFSAINKIEPHKKRSSEESCSQSNKTYKVFFYIFVKQENQTAGFTFRFIEEIPN